MNVERWVRSRRPSWQNLEELLQIIEKQGIAQLDSEQLRELGRLYRNTSADLSRARAMSLGNGIPVYLNNLTVRAHNQVYQRQVNRFDRLLKFLWVSFPELVRENIFCLALAILIFTGPLIVSYCSVLHNLDFAHLEIAKGQPLVPEQMWNIIEQHKMWTDSAADYSPVAASLIASNNIRVAIMAFGLGITFGVGTLYVLFTNGMMIGTIFGVCRTYHLDYRLLAFVAPHGVLELAAIFISGAGGLVLARALIFPGQYSRLDALKLEARPAFGLLAGCIPILLVAGTIEGFISPRTDISPTMKYAVSLATLICLFAYLFVPRTWKNQDDSLNEGTGDGPV